MHDMDRLAEKLFLVFGSRSISHFKNNETGPYPAEAPLSIQYKATDGFAKSFVRGSYVGSTFQGSSCPQLRKRSVTLISIFASALDGEGAYPGDLRAEYVEICYAIFSLFGNRLVQADCEWRAPWVRGKDGPHSHWCPLMIHLASNRLA